MPEVDLPPSDTAGDRGDKHDAPASFTYVPPSGDHLIDPSVHLVFWGAIGTGIQSYLFPPPRKLSARCWRTRPI